MTVEVDLASIRLGCTRVEMESHLRSLFDVPERLGSVLATKYHDRGLATARITLPENGRLDLRTATISVEEIEVIPTLSARTEEMLESVVLSLGKEVIRDLLVRFPLSGRWPTKPKRYPLDVADTADRQGIMYEWFDYYEDCKLRGLRFTLEDLAKEVGYSEGHVKNFRTGYLAEKGFPDPI